MTFGFLQMHLCSRYTHSPTYLFFVLVETRIDGVHALNAFETFIHITQIKIGGSQSVRILGASYYSIGQRPEMHKSGATPTCKSRTHGPTARVRAKVYLGTSIEAKRWACQRAYGPKVVQRPKTGLTEVQFRPRIKRTGNWGGSHLLGCKGVWGNLLRNLFGLLPR
jgi:hypothetical protein